MYVGLLEKKKKIFGKAKFMHVLSHSRFIEKKKIVILFFRIFSLEKKKKKDEDSRHN